MTYASKIEELIAERDALRKDAERYRKLREMHWSTGPLCVVQNPSDDKIRLGTVCPSREQLDEAIDAA